MRRILAVDDERDLVDLLRVVLEGAGFAVETATDGQSALRSLLETPPDLLILDLMMPDLDGFELLKLLRHDPRGAQVPVLILSARSSHQAQIESLQLGASAYISKPFSTRELITVVRQLLRSAGEEGAGDG